MIMREKVEEAINKIRPMLQADGGDVGYFYYDKKTKKYVAVADQYGHTLADEQKEGLRIRGGEWVSL